MCIGSPPEPVQQKLPQKPKVVQAPAAQAVQRPTASNSPFQPPPAEPVPVQKPVTAKPPSVSRQPETKPPQPARQAPANQKPAVKAQAKAEISADDFLPVNTIILICMLECIKSKCEVCQWMTYTSLDFLISCKSFVYYVE